jgi:hypothetical protein
MGSPEFGLVAYAFGRMIDGEWPGSTAASGPSSEPARQSVPTRHGARLLTARTADPEAVRPSRRRLHRRGSGRLPRSGPCRRLFAEYPLLLQQFHASDVTSDLPPSPTRCRPPYDGRRPPNSHARRRTSDRSRPWKQQGSVTESCPGIRAAPRREGVRADRPSCWLHPDMGGDVID